MNDPKNSDAGMSRRAPPEAKEQTPNDEGVRRLDDTEAAGVVGGTTMPGPPLPSDEQVREAHRRRMSSGG